MYNTVIPDHFFGDNKCSTSINQASPHPTQVIERGGNLTSLNVSKAFTRSNNKEPTALHHLTTLLRTIARVQPPSLTSLNVSENVMGPEAATALGKS